MSETQRTAETIQLPDRFKPLMRLMEEHYAKALHLYQDNRYRNGEKEKRLDIRSTTDINVEGKMIKSTELFYADIAVLFCESLHIPPELQKILLMKENAVSYLMEEVSLEDLSRIKDMIQKYIKKLNQEEQHVFLDFCRFMQAYYPVENPMHQTDLYRNIISELVQLITEIPLIYNMRAENGEDPAVEELSDQVAQQSNTVLGT